MTSTPRDSLCIYAISKKRFADSCRALQSRALARHIAASNLTSGAKYRPLSFPLMSTKPNLLLLAAAFLLPAGCSSNQQSGWIRQAEQTHKWGYYSGFVEARWENDGRNMVLLSDLRYTDPNGQVWVAPAGSEVDGASIPRSLWSIMGGPFEGKYRNASVLHDVAYEKHDRPWQDCDRMFYNAMRCSGVGAVEAGTMYYALCRFGHHWKFPIKKAKPVKPSDLAVSIEKYPRALPVNGDQINAARDWIRSAEPNPDEIEQRANAERQ
jgi:Protein of unknown function (DUF1353)